MEYVDIKTGKGMFRVLNIPNFVKAEQFGGQIMVKFINELTEKAIPNPNENCYLKLIGKVNELDERVVSEVVVGFNHTDVTTMDFLDSLLNEKQITIRKQTSNNHELQFKFFENPIIAKIICS